MLLQLDSAAFDSLVKRLLPLFTASMCTKSNYTGTQFGIPACIVHGDLWAPNVLWEKDAEGRASDRLAAIIDWQCIHSGNPCEELQRILSVNTSGKYRRQNTERLLRFYTDKVAEHMADGRAPFTVEQATGTFFDGWNSCICNFQLSEAYRQAMPFSMMSVCFWPQMNF